MVSSRGDDHVRPPAIPACTAWCARRTQKTESWRVRRDAPDHVAGIDVLDVHLEVGPFQEIPLDPGFQEASDVAQHGVAGRVPAAVGLGDVLLPGPFGHDDHRVLLAAQALLQHPEQPSGPLQVERHLGHQDEVHVVQGQGGVGRDEPRVAAHHLHQAEAVAAAPLASSVRAADGLRGHREGGLQPEGLLDEGDVVVDGLGDADHGRSRPRAAPPRGSPARRAACRRRRS